MRGIHTSFMIMAAELKFLDSSMAMGVGIFQSSTAIHGPSHAPSGTDRYESSAQLAYY